MSASDSNRSSNPIALRGDKKCPHGQTKRAACWECVNEDLDIAESQIDRQRAEVERLTRERDELTAKVAELARGWAEAVDWKTERDRLRAALKDIASHLDESYRPGCLERILGDKARKVLSGEPGSAVETTAPLTEAETLLMAWSDPLPPNGKLYWQHVNKARDYFKRRASTQKTDKSVWVLDSEACDACDRSRLPIVCTGACVRGTPKRSSSEKASGLCSAHQYPNPGERDYTPTCRVCFPQKAKGDEA